MRGILLSRRIILLSVVNEERARFIVDEWNERHFPGLN